MKRKQNTTVTVMVGPVLDSSGGGSGGMVIGDFSLSKNGGAPVAMAAAATATHQYNGYYLIAMIAGNVDTVGDLCISCNKATYSMPMFRDEVVLAATYDAEFTNAAGATSGYALVGSAMLLTGAYDSAKTASTQTSVDNIGTNVTAVKNKTDNLPADPADASDLATSIGAVNTLATAIKLKTDNLPADPADASDIAAALSAISTLVSAVKTKTDGLPGDPADASDISIAMSAISVLISAVKTKTDNLPTDPADASDIATATGAINVLATAIKLKTDNLPSNTETTLTALDTKLTGLIDHAEADVNINVNNPNQFKLIKTKQVSGAVLLTQNMSDIAGDPITAIATVIAGLNAP
jgi:hypothetical protein